MSLVTGTPRPAAHGLPAAAAGSETQGGQHGPGPGQRTRPLGGDQRSQGLRQRGDSVGGAKRKKWRRKSGGCGCERWRKMMRSRGEGGGEVEEE